MSTGAVPMQLKPLLAVYLVNFFNTPITRDGKKIDFEQVVTELEKDTIAYTIESGRNVGNSELIRIKFVVEREKYETAINWLKTMLFDSVFDPERFSATLTKMLAEIPDEKRDGNGMANAVDAMVHYSPASSSRAQNTLTKSLYLKRINRLLKDDPSKVIEQMETLRSHLCTLSNFRLFVIANLEKLPKPVSPWSILVESGKQDQKQDLLPLDSRKAVLSDAAKNPGKEAYIVPMPPIDSSYALFTAKGPDYYDHPQLPALMVALAYLDAVEGPMWVAVRGTGLAYGTSFTRGTDTGLLGFRIYRSPDTFKAYSVARQVVKDYISGEREFEKSALEGAISSIVVAFADEQTTMSSAAALGFINLVVKGIPKDWSDGMLKKVRAIGVEEIKQVLREIVVKVFEPGSTDVVVACASIMQEDLKKNFEEVGFKPQVQPLSHFQDDYGLKAAEGEDDDAADEDEDEDDDDDDSEPGEATPSSDEDEE